jgi:hypothetical protein
MKTPRMRRFKPVQVLTASIGLALGVALLQAGHATSTRSLSILLIGSSASSDFMSAYAWGRDAQVLHTPDVLLHSGEHHG